MPTRYAAAAALLVALAGCSADGDSRDDKQPVADPSTSAAEPGATTTAEPERAILDWQPVPGSLDDTVIDAGDWTVTIPESRTEARISGTLDKAIPAGRDRTIQDVFVSDTGFAVVVARDEREERPLAITTVELDTGVTHRAQDPLPAPNGDVAVGLDALHYATYDAGLYCFATAPGVGPGEVTWCASERQGWRNPLDTHAGPSILTFDDQRPSCRTPVHFPVGTEAVPVPGIEECKAWDIGLTADGAVWSTIPQETRIENAHFFARAGASTVAGADGTTYDLGPGVSDSLFSCGDSMFFTRDAGGRSPAQLLRWTPDATLEVAYEAPGTGEGFVNAGCASYDRLTVTAYGEGGDERVSATVPG